MFQSPKTLGGWIQEKSKRYKIWVWSKACYFKSKDYIFRPKRIYYVFCKDNISRMNRINNRDNSTKYFQLP